MRILARSITLLAALTIGPLQGDVARAKRVAPITEESVQTFDQADKFAVVAGIGTYQQQSGIAPLKFPATDARSLAAVLKGQGFATTVLTEHEVTRGGLRASLRAAADAVGQDGTLLFYFSGHGFSGEHTPGRVDNYLAVYETFADELAATGLALSEVLQILDQAPAKRKLLLLDACRNDPGTGGKGIGLRTFAEFEQSEGVAVLYSTKFGGVSYESPALGHGLFTHFLIEGLEGGAAKNDGFVSFRDVADYTQSKVKRWAFERGWSQVPFEAGERSGDFLLAHATRSGNPSGDFPMARVGDPSVPTSVRHSPL